MPTVAPFGLISPSDRRNHSQRLWAVLPKRVVAGNWDPVLAQCHSRMAGLDSTGLCTGNCSMHRPVLRISCNDSPHRAGQKGCRQKKEYNTIRFCLVSHDST